MNICVSCDLAIQLYHKASHRYTFDGHSACLAMSIVELIIITELKIIKTSIIVDKQNVFYVYRTLSV